MVLYKHPNIDERGLSVKGKRTVQICRHKRSLMSNQSPTHLRTILFSNRRNKQNINISYPQ